MRYIKAALASLVLAMRFISFSSNAENSFPGSNLNVEELPPYVEGEDYYLEINGGNPEFETWQYTAFPFVLFSELDELGRAGPAYACIGPETLPKDVRKQIGNIYPSGWQSTRYDDLIEGGYLFNRSHLIGYQLCGDDGTRENLITGTRLLNAGSMLMVESAVEMYIEETGNHVLYRVTPFYHGKDLVPFGVQIEALSMETDLDGICCNLFLYNVQPDIEIDYATGESRRTESINTRDEDSIITEDTIKVIPAVVPEPEPSSSGMTVTYVLNKKTGKFHYPYCKSVTDMKQKNREDVDWDREKVIEEGYKPCGNCNP